MRNESVDGTPDSAGRRKTSVISLAFFVTLAAFLWIYLKDFDFDQLRGLTIEPWLLIAASLVSLISRFLGAMIWRSLLIDLGANVSKNLELLYAYAKSWMGRYLPGKVTWLLAKVYFASKLGIDKERLSISAILGVLLQTVIVVSLSLLLITTTTHGTTFLSNRETGLIAAAAVLISVLLFPPVFNTVFRVTARYLRLNTPKTIVNTRTILKALALYGAGFFISGASLVLFSLAIYENFLLDFTWFAIAAFNLAGVIGMLAFFAPGGIGVREGVLLVLLSGIMPKEIAFTIVLSSRLWLVCMDALFFISVYTIHRFCRRTEDGSHSQI